MAVDIVQRVNYSHQASLPVMFYQRKVPEQVRLHASYNVAKKVVEFEYQEEIPRSRLRAAYGDGFKGAPLRCQSSGKGRSRSGVCSLCL